MNRNTIVAAVAAALAQLCLAQAPAPAPASPGAQTSAATTWRLAAGYRVESFHAQNVLQFPRDVEKATSGKLLIQVFPNNTLVKLADISSAVQQGKAEAGETIMTSMVKDIPLAGADSVPFVVASYADAERLWTLQRPGIEKHFTARGLRANGVKIERIPPDMDNDIRHMGENFSREWARSVGNEANDIFIPYYLKP